MPARLLAPLSAPPDVANCLRPAPVSACIGARFCPRSCLHARLQPAFALALLCWLSLFCLSA
eukprot:10273654-Lingulodinium_polyedra.AAC.1